jgi:hypothetical protein
MSHENTLPDQKFVTPQDVAKVCGYLAFDLRPQLGKERRFHYSATTTVPLDAFALSIDEFSRRYLTALVSAALDNQSPTWTDAMRLPAGVNFAARGWIFGQEVRIVATLNADGHAMTLTLDLDGV